MSDHIPTEFERGKKEGKTDALLEDHTRHLSTINGSIERFAKAVENLVDAVRTLQEESRLDRERVKVAADVLAKETERRREALAETATTSDRKFSKRERVAALLAALAGTYLTYRYH